jgi:flagellar FliJ protein
MKFKFPLESVLKHRKSVEKLAVKSFMEAQQRLEECLSAIRRMYEGMDESRLKIAKLHKLGGANIGEIVDLETFIQGQGIRVDKRREEARELMAEVEHRQDLLQEAVKDVKMMEKIKERRKNEFDLKVQKKEYKSLDDMNIMRFKRGSP